MKLGNIITLAALVLTGLSVSHASPLAGKWTAEFDTLIGVQKYVFEFKEVEGKLTGKCTFERSIGNGEETLKDIKLNGEDVSFVEPFKFDGNDIGIRYAGKLTGDEMKLARHVGDFDAEQVLAKRVKAEAKPEAKPEPKPAPAK